MRKFLLLTLICLSLCATSYAKDIDEYVKKAKLDNASIYILNKNTNEIIYKNNEEKPQNPASLLKTITFKKAYDVLGGNYQFKTELYLDENKNAYIKLGGDVLLTYDDLKKLTSNLKDKEINNIFIDDYIFDKDPYPSSWLDEDKWPRQRAITPYVIDRNYTQINIVRSSLAKKVDVVQNDDYNMPIINELKIDDFNKIKITQPYGSNSPIISLQGTIKDDTVMSVPVLNPEIHFNIKLAQALEKNKIIYLKTFNSRKTPSNAQKIAEVSHSIKSISRLILHNSDNFATEIVLKVAAAKYYKKSQASYNDVVNMLNEQYTLSDNETIADASGVSRKNLLKPTTISNLYLEFLKDEEFKKLLQTSHQGTMTDRLIFLKNNLRIKTGTMRKLSAICADVKTRNDNEILITAIIQDENKRKALLKNFENSLIGIIYKHY
ncbi:MAG: D-alanyl-D-alanine carboxypeptidase [Candidatus Gastranaerophilales bacterium]|nr:D-alanyl-D-alanine carboxypeptidase [Candidatus Gastranaerophilales bacterium]